MVPPQQAQRVARLQDAREHVRDRPLPEVVVAMPATDTLGMLAVFGDPAAPELARTLDLAGYSWKAVGSAEEAAEHEPASGWVAAIVDCSSLPDAAWLFARTI